MSTFDNPIWHSLSSVHAHLAKVAPGARCYDASFAPIAGIEEETYVALTSLASMLENGAKVTLFLQAEPKLPPVFSNAFTGSLIQMICEEPKEVQPVPVAELGAENVDEMIGLARLCNIGLFSQRTAELGTYLGIWIGKQLVSMAGERLQSQDFIEVSAVCTHPDFRGRGYSSAIIHEICTRVLSRGKVPILHVRPDNSSAVHTYGKLGFRERRCFQRHVLKKTF